MDGKKRLGDILVELGYITEEDVKEAIRVQRTNGKRLGKILVDEGLITEESLLQILELQLGIPRLELDLVDVDMKAVSTISEALAKKYTLIPVKFLNGNLVVAMTDPLNIFAEEDVTLASGYTLDIRISSEEEVNNAIAKYYSKDYIKKAEAKLNSKKIDNIDIEEEDLLEVNVNSSPEIKLIDRIIENAVKNRASDIHIEPQKDKIIIRYRIDGKLRKQFEAPKEPLNSMITRIKLLSGMDISERRIPQDGKILTTINNRNVDLRVSILPSINGENLVVRILDKSAFNLSKENLGFSEGDIKKLEKIINVPYGMILVTGPTGSGKTSTLYSIIKELNNDESNIITIEDPVEYSINGITQVNVNNKTGLTFSKGLRAILRQDPDVIMVGEIRDEETANMAVRSAITGHVVLTTLHTNDAISAIDRLKDIGIARYLIASSLSGVIAQRLIRKLCNNCKEAYEASSYEKELLGVKEDIPFILYRSKGCSKCSNTGYKGRQGVFEILKVSKNIRELIIENESLIKIKSECRKEGMKTLREAGKSLVKEGITSVEELIRITLIDE